jgi:hypothetical protein
MYYSNQSGGNQQCPEKAWDSNYLAVYHMNDANSQITDSTIYSNDMFESGNPTYEVDGVVDKCINPDEDDYFVTTENFGGNDNAGTVSAWFKTTDNTGGSRFFGMTDKDVENQRLECIYYSTYNSFAVYGSLGGSAVRVHGDVKANNNVWYYVVITGDGSSTGIFTNDTDGMYKNSITVVDGREGIWFDELVNPDSNAVWALYRPTMGYSENGYLDELRYSNIVRSEDWINTEYKTQNNPSSFLSFGPEEPGP